MSKSFYKNIGITHENYRFFENLKGRMIEYALGKKKTK